MGWRIMDPDDSEAMALVWIEALDVHRIPFSQYTELYRRSVGLRAKRIENGMKCDDFSVELMIACWPSLARELEQRRIDEKRFLPETAESQCQRCFGTGMETIRDSNNPKYSAARPCDHRPLEPDEIAARSPAPRPKAEPQEPRQRPEPKTAIGILIRAKLNGGDDTILSNAIDYLRRQREASRLNDINTNGLQETVGEKETNNFG